MFWEVLTNENCNESYDSLDQAGLDVVMTYYEMFCVDDSYKMAVKMAEEDIQKNASRNRRG